MRTTTGWAVAALVAATGCGGARDASVAQPAAEDHRGADARCGACWVTGGGQILLDGQRVQVAVEAIPVSGPGAGAGFGGTGIAAKGHVRFHRVPSGGRAPDLEGEVDTLGSCARSGGTTSATFSGALAGGGRFTASVTDGGEPGEETLAFEDGSSTPPTPIEHGTLQVHGLDRCEPACAAGDARCGGARRPEPCDGEGEGEGESEDGGSASPAPVAPAPPASPTSPAAPTSPTTPTSPTAPTDPTSPTSPTAPTDPMPPTSPTAPTAPLPP